MRIAYTSWAPRGDSLAMVERANAICREYRSQGYDLTLRQLYYQFVARGHIENNQRSYKRLGDVVNNARMAGLLDWDYIVDRTRNVKGGGGWDNPAQIIKASARSYSIDKRADQQIYLEVWVEKEALAGVIGRATYRLNLPHFSCRGYVSQSEQHAAAKRFLERIQAGQKVVVVHLGDHDPSGIDMTRDITHRISRFLTVGLDRVGMEDPTDPQWDEEQLLRYGYGMDAEQGFGPWDGVSAFHVERIALNMDQVEEYQPPPNPAKLTDSRIDGYLDQFGDQSWELDALEPALLDRLIRGEVREWTDQGKYDALAEREREERDGLQQIADHYDELSWPGK